MKETKFEWRLADREGLERIWDKNIANNPDEPEWIGWKVEYIANHEAGLSRTFLVLADGEPVGEGTLLIDPSCRPVGGNTALADGKTVANVNALRIEKAYEGQGHISHLVRMMEDYARQAGFDTLTIGVDAHIARNVGIYLHWGYNRLVHWEVEDGDLVLYYAKPLRAEG